MQFDDQRTPHNWAVGDLVVSDSEQRYLIIDYDIGEASAGKVSLLSLSTSTVVLTRDDINQLEDDFRAIHTVTEVIAASDIMVVATDE